MSKTNPNEDGNALPPDPSGALDALDKVVEVCKLDPDPSGALDTLDKVVEACKRHPGFLAEFDRLYGSSFTKPGIVQAIDIGCGKRAADEEALRRFVADVVLSRIRKAAKP